MRLDAPGRPDRRHGDADADGELDGLPGRHDPARRGRPHRHGCTSRSAGARASARPTCSTSTSSRSSARASRRTRRRPRRRRPTRPPAPRPLTVSFTGTGADADGDPLTYAWDFTSDGTVDATTANASHTYAEPGEYTATFTVSDGERSRSVEIDIEAYPPLASCPGNDEFDGTSLDTSPLERRAPDDAVPLRRRRLAEPQRPARRGHPRRATGAAQHRAPGPAGLRPVDRDGARRLDARPSTSRTPAS